MTPVPSHPILHQLRQRLAAPEAPAPTDGLLLRRFAQFHVEAAFEALVRRHGPMVWGVCRRLLPGGHDAEDAFQATFLALLQRAASIRDHDSTASWLFGAARRIARRARANAGRRREVERRAPQRRPPDVPSEAAGREVLAIVEEEVARLPERFRAPLVLCGLGGLSKAEAARQLGCKMGTVASRLARARERLRGRLARRGVIVPAAAVGGLLADGAAPAAMPPLLVSATVRTAAQFVAGGGISTSIGVLAGTAAETLLPCKLKVTAALLLGLAVLGAGASLATHRPPEKGELAAQRGHEPGPAPKPEGAAAARTDAFGDPLPPGALARLGSVRLRQPAQQVMFAPDGKTLITTGMDNRISMWDVGTGKYLHGQRIEGTQDFDRSATTLAPDGMAVLVWLWSRQSLLVGGVPTGKKIGSVSLRAGQPYRAALAPGGKAVAAVVNDSNKYFVRVWDVATGAERQLLVHGRFLEAIAFSPDGKLLAAGGGMDAVLRVWDVATGTLLHRLDGRRIDYGLTFSPDNKTLAAWCDDGVVRLWDMATGKEQAAWRAPSGCAWPSPPTARYSPEGDRAASSYGTWRRAGNCTGSPPRGCGRWPSRPTARPWPRAAAASGCGTWRPASRSSAHSTAPDTARRWTPSR
jgi:RNA polymerase sigma factor (sigma-70 family)